MANWANWFLWCWFSFLLLYRSIKLTIAYQSKMSLFSYNYRKLNFYFLEPTYTYSPFRLLIYCRDYSLIPNFWDNLIKCLLFMMPSFFIWFNIPKWRLKYLLLILFLRFTRRCWSRILDRLGDQFRTIFIERISLWLDLIPKSTHKYFDSNIRQDFVFDVNWNLASFNKINAIEYLLSDLQRSAFLEQDILYLKGYFVLVFFRNILPKEIERNIK